MRRQQKNSLPLCESFSLFYLDGLVDCAYESIYGLGVGLSMRGAMIVKSNQMISQWWRSNYRYFDWLAYFSQFVILINFLQLFFDYSRSGCVSEVPKLPAYSVACSRSSMESLPPPVSWNSLTSRRPMGKRYLFQAFFFSLSTAKIGGQWQTKKNDDVETLSGSMRATFVHFRYEVPIDIGSRLGV